MIRRDRAEWEGREPLEILARIDERLEAVDACPASLDPSRRRATRLVDLGGHILAEPALGPWPPERRLAFAHELARVVEAILESFPANIFWDLDHLAFRLADAGDPEAMHRLADRIARLPEGYGRHSTIRFRYAHDFLYGFDWARWVARDPERRASVGPLDDRFLDHLERRRGEIAEEIERNGETYGALEPGEVRNPFAFAREPEDERRLHEALAADGLVPVRAWTRTGEPAWNRDYTAIREEVAGRLDVPVRPG